MIVDSLQPLSEDFSLIPCLRNSALASYRFHPLRPFSGRAGVYWKAYSLSMLPSLQVRLRMNSNADLACLSSAKLNVTKLKSRHRMRTEEGIPLDGCVGRKVQ